MMDTDTTNLIDDGDTSDEDTAAVETEVDIDAEDEQPFEEDSPIDPGEDEEVELDEGLKLKVPSDQAQRVREGWLRHADYTRKTQALSDERRTLAAEREAVQQAAQQEYSAYAQASSLGTQIEQMDQKAAGFGGWAAWAGTDPLAANQALQARTGLEQARQLSLGQLQQLTEQRISDAQQETARRIEQARAILEQDGDIGGWDASKAAAMLDGGVREYGFDRSEIEELSDARMVKVLHDGLKWRAHLEAQQQAQRHVRAQQARPAATVGPRSAPPHGLDDRLGTEEWVRRRNAQVRKRA
jgi:hypothetical protein